MRAREPDRHDVVERAGVRITYDVYGEGARTMLFLPAWSIVNSRIWKMQIPYFARHARVVTFDGRGNGGSGRTPELDYSDEAFVADALAVMDATQTDRATLVALSAGARWGLMLAARHPERVERLVFIAPAVPLGQPNVPRSNATARFDQPLERDDGWSRINRHFWRERYRDFLEFFFAEALPEPHSTRPLEETVAWNLDTTPATLAATVCVPQLDEPEAQLLAASVRCPVLVLHGDADRIVPLERGRALADATAARVRVLAGSGHLPQTRAPVAVNLAIREFIDASPPPRDRRSARKRALMISSPIGLGHALRDVAIAHELRALVPGLTIDWLLSYAQVMKRSPLLVFRNRAKLDAQLSAYRHP